MGARGPFRRRQSDTDLQQEIDLHLAEEIAENTRAVWPWTSATSGYASSAALAGCAKNCGDRILFRWWILFRVICAKCFDGLQGHRLLCSR